MSKSIDKKNNQDKLKSKMTEVCTRLSKIIPDPKPELIYYSPYQFLISVVLSAHSTDKMVNKCMVPYYKAGFSIDSVLKMKISQIEKIIKPIGLYKNKAKFIVEITRKLHTEFDDKVPQNRELLTSLPGVGQKTASVILSCLYHQPYFPVDTHIFRLTKRLGFHSFEKKDIEKVEPLLLSITDKKFLPDAHHLFLLYGRYFCKSLAPKCEGCPLTDLCLHTN